MRDFERLERIAACEWLLPAHNRMNVPARIFADEATVEQLRADDAARSGWSALRQLKNVAGLPGIVGEALALPDVHPGYGFPIGGVAAFDPDDGVAVVGGVGFDINCGVRLMATPRTAEDVLGSLDALGKDLFSTVPAGLGSKGKLRLSIAEIDRVLTDGAAYAVDRGFGLAADLEVIEENGRIPGADPSAVSDLAKQRQFAQVGTLGSGNHYLEVQRVDAILDPEAAEAYGLFQGQIVVSIHTGSRALGHQIGQDYLATMAATGARYGIEILERELVCAPIDSPEGAAYLGAVAAGANCAFANRQAIGHLVREAFVRCLGLAPTDIQTVYDIGHNNAKFEEHVVDRTTRRLLVHRKGSTRAFGPNHPASPPRYRAVGHPIFVGGTMGTASYVLRGTETGMERTFGSGIHGAGRRLSRKKASKKYWGEGVISDLAGRGIRLLAHSRRGVAEEAPGAYKDVERVVEAAVSSGINRIVARMRPLVVIKG
jgi:tRNA-splicing ligase RtcB